MGKSYIQRDVLVQLHLSLPILVPYRQCCIPKLDGSITTRCNQLILIDFTPCNIKQAILGIVTKQSRKHTCICFHGYPSHIDILTLALQQYLQAPRLKAKGVHYQQDRN